MLGKARKFSHIIIRTNDKSIILSHTFKEIRTYEVSETFFEFEHMKPSKFRTSATSLKICITYVVVRKSLVLLLREPLCQV